MGGNVNAVRLLLSVRLQCKWPLFHVLKWWIPLHIIAVLGVLSIFDMCKIYTFKKCNIALLNSFIEI